MMNIPGKFDVSGDLVHAIYYNPNLSQKEKKALLTAIAKAMCLTLTGFF